MKSEEENVWREPLAVREFSVLQNLANKLGVKVRAPTSAVTIQPNGSLTGTGRFIDFIPGAN